MASIDHKPVGLQGPGVGLAIVGLVFAVLSSATVTGRILSRFTTKRILGKDDYIMVASLAFAIAFTIVTTMGVSYGYGRPAKSLSKEQLHSALKTFFACQITYKLSMNLTKISILTLYLRVFPNKWFQLFVRWFLAALIVFAIASVGATILQCQPIARNWNHDLPGRCFALVTFWYFNAAISIFSDLVILLAPMPLILVLQLPRSQKVGLVVIFGLGVFVCITSVVRMTVLKTGATAIDTNHNTLQSTIWTAVECHTAIICASLPMLKSYLTMLKRTLAKMFPRIFSHSGTFNTEVKTEMDHSYDHHQHHHHNHHHHPIPSHSMTRVKNDCEAATPVSPACCYKYSHPTSLKTCNEGYPCDHKEELTTSLSSHLDQKIPAPIPKVYCPKGGGACCSKGYCPKGGSGSCCPPPTDVITKTTDIDIRVDYARDHDDEAGDSSSTDSIFRFGSQVSSSGNHSNNHNYNSNMMGNKCPSRQSRK